MGKALSSLHLYSVCIYRRATETSSSWAKGLFCVIFSSLTGGVVSSGEATLDRYGGHVAHLASVAWNTTSGWALVICVEFFFSCVSFSGASKKTRKGKGMAGHFSPQHCEERLFTPTSEEEVKLKMKEEVGK